MVRYKEKGEGDHNKCACGDRVCSGIVGTYFILRVSSAPIGTNAGGELSRFYSRWKILFAGCV